MGKIDHFRITKAYNKEVQTKRYKDAFPKKGAVLGRVIVIL
ncbi:hypothetical protein [Mesobacillus foraminis]|nr:hypothetical protein [Mesobacillus foraminis]